jgi:hypothetical protein
MLRDGAMVSGYVSDPSSVADALRNAASGCRIQQPGGQLSKRQRLRHDLISFLESF